ncbi:GcrA family cell cycle regulator [Labrys neptuniae]
MWNDQSIEKLKELWGSELSASQIATKLGASSRNAVIGKAHRLGFPARPRNFGGVLPTSKAVRAGVAKCSEQKRKPKITLAVPASQIAEEEPAMNSGQNHRVPTGPLGREECMTAQLGPSISASSGASSGRAVEAGSSVHFLELRYGQCKYPLWADGAALADKFCCGARSGDRPYCEEHRIICTGIGTPAERRAHHEVAA